jgi:hypothetical protein
LTQRHGDTEKNTEKVFWLCCVPVAPETVRRGEALRRTDFGFLCVSASLCPEEMLRSS